MIYVVRHGQTDLNKDGILQGRLGMPLNNYGIGQAERLRESLKAIPFDYIFSSPQERAIQTAEIATGMKAIVDPRLDVFDLGEADRLHRSEVKMAGIVPDATVYKGVEQVPLFIARVFAFMKELEGQYGLSKANILISGHRCTTGCMGAYFQGMPEDGNLLRHSSDNGQYKTYEWRNA
ncbi:histidine phosphatase family protein [Paenibacillus sp. MMS18-CY102]|uniref:histidine phosphatase family protein n=1 Tax=Paenibacillus sp. MMS18-CY102 TaxID=2682849 RepID=UPI0013658256|nr:histidine phosphatase family protein [Paenibacillus sp. MMS18-CY102]MWC27155.1 histidine phosphatase family protein [Paenibacillus sp. MMS18-CY102]